MKYLRGQISPKNGTTSKLFNKDNVLLINKQNLTDGFNDSNLNTMYAFFISNARKNLKKFYQLDKNLIKLPYKICLSSLLEPYRIHF